ncbi:hypothetical protein NDU88_004565 [Pleurodeles waltl]|uniref:Uncharacterized protein n=1 Tax=Pleurodeles waltl TaxID=8319 RepID=A0AAV7V3X1_PLEWA|nr:hypothetical protein NDU88_004565 [Pleurodeles waltl]
MECGSAWSLMELRTRERRRRWSGAPSERRVTARLALRWAKKIGEEPSGVTLWREEEDLALAHRTGSGLSGDAEPGDGPGSHRP